MRAIFQTVKSPTQLKPVALLTAMTLALTACGTDSKPNIGGGNTANPTVNTTKTIQNTPVAFLADIKSASNLSEGGEMIFEITLTEEAKQAINNSDKADFSVAYTLTGNNIADSDKTGTVTLNKDNLSKTIKIPLKSDGKASDNNKISLVLSNPTTTATNAKTPEVSPLTATLERNIANSDSGVQIHSTTITKGAGESKVALVVNISPKAIDEDVTVFFGIQQGTAKENIHYKQPTNKSVVITKGTTEAMIEIPLIGDAPATPVEFSVKLTSANAQIFEDKRIAKVVISSYQADKPKIGTLNDTGVTSAGNPTKGNLASCSGTTQDCHTGRDNTHNNDADGKAGFSFTKLSSTGETLANDATEWACIKDNVTGLIWETKTYNADESKKDIRDATWQYTYYNSAKNFGEKDTGSGSGKDKNTCGNENHICTTEQYAVTVNAMNLCGVKNWRVPTRNEIFGVMNLSSKESDVVLHKGWLLPNNLDKTDINLWTSSVASDSSNLYKFGNHVWLAYYNGTFSAENVKGRYSVPANNLILVSNGK